MTPEGVKRKISAILSADVVGYTRLMEADEEATVRTIQSYRKTVASLIEQHDGNVIDSPGDNILSEFGSVVDAVQCGVEIQHVIKAKNAVLPEARRMEFRIGINLGDVIAEEGRLYGDGINIAARIEGLADAGGICISEAAYQQIRTKLLLGYEDLGEQSLKNITDPVRVYRIPLGAGGVDAGAAQVDRRWRNIAIGAVAVMVVVVGLVLIPKYTSEPPPTLKEAMTQEPEDPTESEQPLVEKPSIAVLPFDNMSGDPEQTYFSDGISEDILNGLAKNPGLDVIARTSSFRFRNEDQDIRDIGGLLGVTHVLEGSVRRAGNRIRVTSQLIAAEKGVHLWSEQYDRKLIDVFRVQDEIAGAILKELSIQLVGPTEGRESTESVEAYDAYLLGRHYHDRAQFDKAATAYRRAVSLDTAYADAYAALAYIHDLYAWWSLEPAQEQLPVIRNLVDRALSLNPNQPDALAIRGVVRFYVDRDYQGAIDEMARMVEKHPGSRSLSGMLATMFTAIGRHDLSLGVLDAFLVLDPLNPRAHKSRGDVLLLAGRLQEARQAYERAGMLGLDEPLLLAWVAMCERDPEGIQEQVDRGEEAWVAGRNWYLYFKAMAMFLRAEHGKVRETLAPLWDSTGHVSSLVKCQAAALEGNLGRALDFYAQAVAGSERRAIRENQAPYFLSIPFPEFRSSPQFQRILRDAGLDEESIGRLKMPMLPF